MIVYGDPPSQESLRSLVERVRKSVSAARSGSHDERRRALILLGILEQALEDTEAHNVLPLVRSLTDLTALGFVRSGESPSLTHPFNLLALAPDRPLTVKQPEGFSFYALYPEAYVEAAWRWLDAHPRPGGIVVVGVRSVGTTLSAVVQAALQDRVGAVRRLTVRPTGHPFAREAQVPTDLTGTDWALVVDEGPGLSGSSMAAVAEACVRAGIARDRIAFLPGHGGEPGPQASESVRDWWRDVPRFVVPTEDLRWDGRTLEETLAVATGDAVRVEELTGGRWRESVYDDRAEWPGVVMAFERRKILDRRSDGSAILWKFVGLSVEGSTLGFAPTPWIESRALRREDATPALLAQIGQSIGAAAGPPLSKAETQASWERLSRMARHNLAEAGLQDPTPAPPQGEGSWTAGDYRLAPGEWRLVNGKPVKAGRISPTLDHTVVGRQPVGWDIAGAMVEWGLDDVTAAPLLAAAPYESPEALRFYRLAYAAFRIGMCRMGTFEEEDRLRRDETFYREALGRVL